MIYIFCGNDNKKKNIYLRKLYKKDEPIFIQDGMDITKEKLFDYAKSMSLFGEYPVIVLENIIKKGEINFSKEEMVLLGETETIFVFLEEKLLVADIKKYEKYAKIEDFNIATVKQSPKINIFGIADAFARRDKMTTWILYREAVSVGVAPEEISGIIFWKIKTMILAGTKIFSIDELKIRSSELVSLYHESHRGETDFTVGLEQFILSALNK
jgi:hypothetical protein